MECADGAGADLEAARCHHPSAPAQCLCSRRTHAIKLLILDIPIHITPKSRALLDEAAAAGDNLLVCNTALARRPAAALCDRVRGQRVDGMIFTSIVRGGLPVLRDVVMRHVLPIVLANRLLKIKSDYVGIDKEAGAHAMTEHLYALDYRCVAFVAGPPQSSTSAARLRGYRGALKTAKIRFDAAFLAGDRARAAHGAYARSLLRTKRWR